MNRFQEMLGHTDGHSNEGSIQGFYELKFSEPIKKSDVRICTDKND